jgi:hypothetical protein
MPSQAFDSSFVGCLAARVQEKTTEPPAELRDPIGIDLKGMAVAATTHMS